MMLDKQMMFKVKCKWCKGKFFGNRVVPDGEPTREFTATITASSRSTLGQVQYLLAQQIRKEEGLACVYVCDMKVLDKTMVYDDKYYQPSLFEREVYV